MAQISACTSCRLWAAWRKQKPFLSCTATHGERDDCTSGRPGAQPEGAGAHRASAGISLVCAWGAHQEGQWAVILCSPPPSYYGPQEIGSMLRRRAQHLALVLCVGGVGLESCSISPTLHSFLPTKWEPWLIWDRLSSLLGSC